MKYSEVRMDLFEVPSYYYLAHAISSDAAMGAGIAKDFAKKYPSIKMLKKQSNPVGSCVCVPPVLNLVTKRVYYGKPTYKTLEASLKSMKAYCLENEVKYVACPKIGCGLDRLSWGKVREIINEVFSETDIEILVCSI